MHAVLSTDCPIISLRTALQTKSGLYCQWRKAILGNDHPLCGDVSLQQAQDCVVQLVVQFVQFVLYVTYMPNNAGQHSDKAGSCRSTAAPRELAASSQGERNREPCTLSSAVVSTLLHSSLGWQSSAVQSEAFKDCVVVQLNGKWARACSAYKDEHPEEAANLPSKVVVG